jgi:hypothetical protein
MSTVSRTRLRILFFLHSANLDRLYAPLLETLLARGHEAIVVVEERGEPGPGSGAVLERLAREQTGFSSVPLPELADDWRWLRRKLRAAVDFLRYLEPEYRDATAVRARARRRARGPARAAERPLAAAPPLRRSVGRALRRLEAAVPVGPAVRDDVAEQRPDLVLVAPLVSIGSAQGDWIRVAAELGVPSVLPVASWDNLSNKGLVKHEPARTIVWNETQADEAVRLHGLARGRVVVAGAHSFDHWFGREPSEGRAELAARAGLPDGRPFLLYAGSSRFVAGDETGFVREWVRRLRESGDPRLAEVAVLVRPHPLNAEAWAEFDPQDDLVAVWPRGGAFPTDEAARAAFFDSLHHATAVVGVNTSALIEAAIAGTPVFTLAGGRFRETQEGTLHFAYVADERDGVLVVARDWDEHLRQLGEALERPDLHRERLERFLLRFVRPHGLDVAAAPLAADALEELAAQPVEVETPTALDASLRRALLAARRARRGWKRLPVRAE